MLWIMHLLSFSSSEFLYSFHWRLSLSLDSILIRLICFNLLLIFMFKAHNLNQFLYFTTHKADSANVGPLPMSCFSLEFEFSIEAMISVSLPLKFDWCLSTLRCAFPHKAFYYSCVHPYSCNPLVYLHVWFGWPWFMYIFPANSNLLKHIHSA